MTFSFHREYTSIRFSSENIKEGGGEISVSPGGAYTVELPAAKDKDIWTKEPRDNAKPGQIHIQFEGSDEAILFGKKLIEAGEQFRKEWDALSRDEKEKRDKYITVKIK